MRTLRVVYPVERINLGLQIQQRPCQRLLKYYVLWAESPRPILRDAPRQRFGRLTAMGFNDYLSAQFGYPTGLGGRLVTLVMSRQNRPLYEAVTQLLNLSDDDRVLDIGCGNGFVLSLLASRSGASFTGIDVSPSMVTAATMRNRRYIREGRMSILHEDAATLSSPDGAFTKTYTINTVYFWRDLDKTMVEIRRVLRPGGLFVNTLYTNETLQKFSHTKMGYQYHEPQALIDSAENAGFEAMTVPLLGNSAYALVCRANPPMASQANELE